MRSVNLFTNPHIINKIYDDPKYYLLNINNRTIGVQRSLLSLIPGTLAGQYVFEEILIFDIIGPHYEDTLF